MTEQSQGMHNAMTDMVGMAVKVSDQFVQLMQQVSSKTTSDDDPSASVMTDFNEAFEEFSGKLSEDPNVILEGQVSLKSIQ